MSNREVARLGFRLLGIYIFAEALPLLGRWIYGLSLYVSTPPSMGQALYPPFRRSMRYGMIADGIGSLLLLALAFVLIVYCRQLAARTFESSEDTSTTQRTMGLAALSYSVLGLYLFTSRLPELVRVTVEIGDRNLSFGVQWIAALLPPLLTMGVGLGLFLGSHGQVRTWSRLRYSGLRRQMGLCLNCGYDLTGNTSGQCPECGTAIIGTPPPAPRVLLRDGQMTNLDPPRQTVSGE